MDCKHFGSCGSCRNYEGGYDVQLNAKLEEVRSRFAPFYEGDFFVARSEEAHYRARSEFKIWHVGDASYYAMNNIEKGADMVLIEECPKVSRPIAELMAPLLAAVKEAGEGKKLFGIDFLSATNGDMAVTLLYHRKLDDIWQKKMAALAERFGIGIIGRSRKQKLVIGRDHVVETLTLGGRDYRFKHIENSFTQPNPRVNEQMVGWALEQFEGIGGDLLELYCGAGNFTIPFASRFSKVLATEISKSSINAARDNMALNGVENIAFVRMSAEEFVQALDGVREFNRMQGIDLAGYALQTLFVDPPRAGMDEESCAFASRFEHLLYISCNPETLARDLARLEATHEVTAMAVFDQFPYTDHLEMGVKLRKRG